MSSPPDANRPLRVLVANHQFWRFSGSEVHAMQVAGHFRDQGAEAVVFGVTSEPWLVAEIEGSGLRFAGLRDIRRAAAAGFDVVWTHHETAFFLMHVLLGVRCRLAVHGILSRVASLERMPLMPPIGRVANLAVLANSDETRDAVSSRSGQDGIGVLRNLVPQAFFDHPKAGHAPALRRLVVVSNHVPDEVIAAVPLLRERGVALEIIGEGHRYVLVDQSTLTGFDAVVTIGKTAQYAIVQGIPVFLYDVFGGPGYLRPETADRDEAFNFSGRSRPDRLSAAQFADALVEGYPRAVADARALRASHADRYRIGAQTDPVLARMRPERAPLLGAAARLRLAAATAATRPSVPLRLAAPRGIDAAGDRLKALAARRHPRPRGRG